MLHRQLYSPRRKELKQDELKGLNSYKIDTNSLGQKARQIQLLKYELQTQISQFKQSQISYQQELIQIRQQNQRQFYIIYNDQINRLKQRNYTLQNQLVLIKQQNKSKIHMSQKQIQKYNNQIDEYKKQLYLLKQQLNKNHQQLINKNQIIQQLQEYKIMYQIQVENKNNIRTYYQNKLNQFKKNHNVLIEKYQQKISVLESGFDFNNNIINQNSQNNYNNNSVVSGNFGIQGTNTNITSMNNFNSFNNLSRFNSFSTHNNIEISSNNNNNSYTNNNMNNNSYTNNKISVNNESVYKNQTQNILKSQKSIKLLKNPSKKISIQIQNNKQIQILTSHYKQPHQYQSSKQHNFTTPSSTIRNNNNNKLQSHKNMGTNKTLKKQKPFLNLVRCIFQNLRQSNLKTQNLKQFINIKQFTFIINPTQYEIIKLLNQYPFSPIKLQDEEIEDCIEKMRDYLMKKYGNFTGNLFIETLIDKLEDFQIAYEVNSDEEDRIVAGLSSQDSF